VSDSGYGTGFGDGYGYGFGYGIGFGYGYGYGDGDGCGYGYGIGYGYGHGHGLGYGFGYGSGYGYGYGCTITTIAGHKAHYHPPFTIIAVGCETHTIEHWMNNWREIAEKHEVDVSEKDVEKILTKITQGEDQ
jgi:hypothetical protein